MHHSGRPCGQSCRRSPDRGVQRRLPGRPGFFAVWTGPNDGAVKVANTNGCAATVSGTSFMPPAGSAIRTCQTSPLYSCEQDGQTEARRLPQQT